AFYLILARLRLYSYFTAFAAGVYLRYFGAGHYLYTRLFKIPFELLGNIFVFYRHNSRHEFYDRHLSAYGMIKIGKLNPDGARTHDYHRLGLLVQAHGFAVANDLFVVNFQVGQFARPSARGNNNMFG